MRRVEACLLRECAADGRMEVLGAISFGRVGGWAGAQKARVRYSPLRAARKEKRVTGRIDILGWQKEMCMELANKPEVGRRSVVCRAPNKSH